DPGRPRRRRVHPPASHVARHAHLAGRRARLPHRGPDADRLSAHDVQRNVPGRNFALLFKVFFLSVALVVLLVSLRYFREGRWYQGEYYYLLLTSFLGCVLMPSSRDLLMLFISLELVSAPGFLIAAFRKSDPR